MPDLHYPTTDRGGTGTAFYQRDKSQSPESKFYNEDYHNFHKKKESPEDSSSVTLNSFLAQKFHTDKSPETKPAKNSTQRTVGPPKSSQRSVRSQKSAQLSPQTQSAKKFAKLGDTLQNFFQNKLQFSKFTRQLYS